MVLNSSDLKYTNVNSATKALYEDDEEFEPSKILCEGQEIFMLSSGNNKFEDRVRGRKLVFQKIEYNEST